MHTLNSATSSARFMFKILPFFAIPVLVACQTASVDTPNTSLQLIDQDEFGIREEATAREERLARQQLISGFLAGKMAGNQARMEEAADHFGQSLAVAPEDASLLSRTIVYQVAAGDIEEAIDTAEKLVKKDPNHGLAVLTLLVRDARDGKFTGTAERLQALHRTGNILVPVNIARQNRGNRHAVQYQKSIHAINQGLVLGLAAWLSYGEDNSWRPKHLLGSSFDPKLGKLPQQLRLPGQLAVHDWAFSRLDLKDPVDVIGADDAVLGFNHYNDMRVLREVLAALAADGMEEAAEKRLAETLKRVPGNVTLERLSGLVAAGQHEQPHLRDPQGGMAAALFDTAHVLSLMRLRLASVTMLRLAEYLDPDQHYIDLLLAENLQSLEQREKADKVLRAIPADSLDGREAGIDLVYNLAQLDRMEEAISILEDMVKRDETDMLSASVLGKFLHAEERFEEAAAALDMAIERAGKIEKRHWSLFYDRAKAYERSKQWAKAEPDFLKALELSPDQPYVLNYLGYSWVDMGLHLDKALGMIDKAVKKRPNEGFIVDSLGWAYYKLERYQEAEKYLLRAVSLAPSDPLLLDHYGDALWQNGHHREARFQWERAKTFGAEDDVLASIEDKLKNGLTR